MSHPTRVGTMLREGAAKRPEDLPAGWYVARWDRGPTREYTLHDDNNREIGRLHTRQDSDCKNAWIVTSSRAKKGWGPLLYDVALEDAGSKGLMPDRMWVTSEALRIWDYYMNQRGDVLAHPLEDLSQCGQHGDDDDWDDELSALDYRYVSQNPRIIRTLQIQDAWRDSGFQAGRKGVSQPHPSKVASRWLQAVRSGLTISPAVGGVGSEQERRDAADVPNGVGLGPKWVRIAAYDKTPRLIRARDTLPQKANFYGMDGGHWTMDPRYLIGPERREWDWAASSALSSQNDWRNLMVDGATENHQGFRKALREMVRKYPELNDWIIQFDGPWRDVSDLVGGPATKTVDWSKLTFYHGTSDAILDKVRKKGLQPRSETNVEPAYGAHIDRARPGRVDAVYLTTQTSMAAYAAYDAVRKVGGSPIILEVQGIHAGQVAPDVDSRETDAAASLARMGSIAYIGTIRPTWLKRVFQLDSREWQRLASRMARLPSPARVAARWLQPSRMAAKLWYHGSPKSFEDFETYTGRTFGTGASEVPLFFSPDRNFAKLYAQGPKATLFTVQLKFRNPFDSDDLVQSDQYWPPPYENLTSKGKQLYDDLIAGKVFPGMDEDDLLDGSSRSPWAQILRHDYDVIETTEFKQWLKRHGYDAAYVTGDGPTNIFVFDPSQVKIIKVEPAHP